MKVNMRTEEVEKYFEHPQTYLKMNYNIKIRSETVRDFLLDSKPATILDIGCGDGSIALPFLDSNTKLTLIDLSEKMLLIASSKISPELKDNVVLINKDFMSVDIRPESYDLILCLGVLAHAASPYAMLKKVVSLVKPGGGVIIQNTDIRHPISRLSTTYSRFKNSVFRSRYNFNLISDVTLKKLFAENKLSINAEYKYCFYIPFVQRFASNITIYKTIRYIFGSCLNQRNGWLGNEHIYYFKKDYI